MLTVASIFLVAGAVAYATMAAAPAASPPTSSSPIDGNDFGFIDESGQQTSRLSVSWRIDPDETGFVKSSKKIFDLTAGDQASLSMSSSNTLKQSSTSSKQFAEKSAQRYGLSGTYGAFNAAVQMSSEALTSERHQQYRETRSTLAKTRRLTLSVPHPSSRLNPDVKEFFLSEPVEKIHGQYGDFFATEMTLGGVMEVSVTATMFEGETEDQARTSLEAGYSAISVSAEASFSASTASRKQIGEKTYHYQAKTHGGHSPIWLGVTSSNQGSIQAKWAESLTESNEYPIDFKFRPLWELLEGPGMDRAKADELKTHMLDRWQSVRLIEYSAAALPDPDGFIIGLKFTATEKSSAPEGYLREDVNKGFGGKYTYVGQVSGKKSQACAGFEFVRTRHAIGYLPAHSTGDMAKGAGGDYRYLKPVFHGRRKVKEVWWTENANEGGGDKGCTGDVNAGREGRYLYFCWRTE